MKDSNKKIMLSIIGIAVLLVGMVGMTYAFFNYTRTGTRNVIKVGRIYFNSEQGDAINLSNVFPIDKSTINSDTDNVGSVTIHITGDTTYTEGIEYLVSAVDVNNTIGEGNNQKTIPISVDVSYSANGNDSVIGTSDEEYFDNRGGNSSIYKVLENEKISNNGQILVGYIAPGVTGIDGIFTIKAFLDKDKIAISDTYPQKTKYIVNSNMTSQELSGCVTYINSRYSYYFDDENTAESYCLGTGKVYNKTFQEMLDESYFNYDINTLLTQNIIIVYYEDGTPAEWVNGRTVFTTSEWNTFQTNGISFKVKVEANEGIWAEKINLMNEIPYQISQYKNNVKEIYFSQMSTSRMQQEYDAATIKADITYQDIGKVLAWLENDTVDNTKYIMYIVSDGVTYLTTGQYLFANYENVEKIEFENINTSNVTTMFNMFRECYKLNNMDISMFDTKNVTTVQYMFKHCHALDDITVGNLDFRSLINMMGMFEYCSSLKSMDLSGFKTNIVENMGEIFYNCTLIEDIDMHGLGSNNLTSISMLFQECGNLKNVNMSNFNFGSSSLDYMFSYAYNLEIVNFHNANTTNVVYMRGVFSGTSVKNVDMTGMGGNNLSDISSMFYGCTNLENINMSYFNFGRSSLNKLFNGLTSVEIIDLSNINILNTTGDAYNMFNDCISLTTIYVSNDIDFSIEPNYMPMFGNNTSLIGGNGTTFDNSKLDKNMAVIDTPSTPGYLTLKTS